MACWLPWIVACGGAVEDFGGMVGYLRNVYPTADLSSRSLAEVRGLFLRADMFYTVHLTADLLKLVNLTCHPSRVKATIVRRRLEDRFPGLGRCTSGRACVRSAASYIPPWAPVQTPVARVGHSFFVEVTRLAHECKRGRRKVRSAADWLDQGPAAFWYQVSQGSGIAYETGKRTLVAPTKNLALSALLDELALARDGRARSRVVRLEEAVTAFVGMDVARLQGSLRTSIAGEPCASVGLKCHTSYLLQDFYDPILVGIGRFLGYTSLAMTASPVAILHTKVAEVVDLRLPPAPAQGPDPFALERERVVPASHRRRWTSEQAQAWVRHYRTVGRLSLRDPLSSPLGGRGATRTCDFYPNSTRLACNHHVSTTSSWVGGWDDRCSPR